MNKIRWGVLSTAKIGLEKVIPAIQKSNLCTVIAIASDKSEKIKTVASRLSIPKTYDNYDDLLHDQEVDAVYIPLPNQLHVEWSIKALQAGKHVLCEKPLGLSSEDVLPLLNAARQHPQLKIMEAFMYRFHPQWIKVKQLLHSGIIGSISNVQSFFSYSNTDPNNIRNKKETGGGALMDIGCYCISFARYIFEEEPIRVMGMMEIDENFQVDRKTSGIMEFPKGSSAFTCSTQLAPFQRLNIFGSEGMIEVQIPVNAPVDTSTIIHVISKAGKEDLIIPAADQYTNQAEEFSKSILNNTPVPTSLDDAYKNMKVIDAIVKSAKENKSINIQP